MGRAKRTGWPVVKLDRVFHVGLMNPKAKGKASFEGAGLSVSLHPGAWVEIAELGGLPWWELNRPDGQFLNIHLLSKRQRKEIEKWGLSSRMVVPGVGHEVSWVDPDDGDRRSFLFDEIGEATDEFESLEPDQKPKLREIATLQPTKLMRDRLGVTTGPDIAEDHLTTLFVEDVLKLDGVWWKDRLDLLALSAPRGVIVPSMVASWNVRSIKPFESSE